MDNEIKYMETDSFYDSRLRPLADTLLRTEDRCVFNVHKFALAKSSKYFNALFCGMGKARNDILVPGVKGDILSMIISFIYTGSASVTDEKVCELMLAADYLLLDELLSSLKIYLQKNISVENCLSLYIAAQQISRPDILQQCYRFVLTHFESVLLGNSAGFEDLPPECLGHFLSDRNLCVSDEKVVYLAMAKWVAVNKSRRQCFVPDFLKCLSMGDVSEELAAEILADDFIEDNPFCQSIKNAKKYVEHAGNFNVLLSCLHDPCKPAPSGLSRRQPPELNCIARYVFCEGRHAVQFYITYDERSDLWRRILEVEFSPQIVISVGDYIYMFGRGDYVNFRYSITKKELSVLNGFTFPRYKDYAVVVAGGKLHALGGVTDMTGDEIDVEAYDAHYGFWYPTAQMIPVNSFGAVALGKFIYAVGVRFHFGGGHEMVAQVYDATLETWDLLPAVTVDRSHFAMVAYRGRVYVIGGIRDDEQLKDVEAFDPTERKWTKESPLPHAYNVPKAIVLQDFLIVYDNHEEDREYVKTNLPVFWDVQTESWKIFGGSWPNNQLQLYQFLTVDQSEIVSALTIENRKTETHFEKSPFVE